MAIEELDIDSLQDDDLDAIIAQAEQESGSPEVEMQEAHIEVPEGTEDNEDTDQEEDSDIDDAEPNDESDGGSQDNDEDAEETTEENTQVDDEDESPDNKGEDDTDTKDQNDANDDDQGDQDDNDTGEGDLQKQYEELQKKYEDIRAFYDEVTSDFKANGKMVKGITDPAKIRQMSQMALGYSEKMAGFKPYRPFMSALKEQGILDNPEKFDFAMDLLKGNPEAVKKLIKDVGVDPVDLLDESDESTQPYKAPQYRDHEATIILDDLIQSAKMQGVDDKFAQELGGQWTADGSLQSLLSNPSDAAAIINHMSNVNEDGVSVYDEVQARIADKKLTDVTGLYAGKSTYEQYRIAADELAYEEAEAQKQRSIDEIAQRAEQVELEKQRIEDERKQREYAARAEQEQRELDKKRSKATASSKPKVKAKSKPKTFDPLQLNDDELDDFLATLQ